MRPPREIDLHAAVTSARRGLGGLALVVAAACGDGDDAGADDTHPPDDVHTDPVADSDPVVDSDPAADSDAVDSDTDRPPDSDVAETDPSLDSDVADSEPVDTEPPFVPPDLGGGFTDVTADAWASGRWFAYTEGPLQRPSEAPAAVGDLDGDGLPEVFPNSVGDHDAGNGPGLPLRARPDDTWAPDDALSGWVDPSLANVLGVVDLDGDGLDDVLRSSLTATINLGRGPLAPVPRSAGVVTRPGRVNAGVSAALVDVDLDGWLDVALGQETCGVVPPLTFLHRVGTSAWEERVDLVPLSPTVGSRIVLPLPTSPGGPAWLVTGWSCGGGPAHGGFYDRSGTSWDGLPTWGVYDATPANAWFKQSPSGVSGTLTGQAPMGAAVLDLDADGQLELIVTVSEVRQYVYRLKGTRLLEDVTAATALDFPKLLGTTEREAWAVAPVDLDLDGRPELAIAQGDDAVAADLPIATRVSFARLFWADPLGAWHDVGASVGLDAALGNWHSLLPTDLDGDLDADLVVGGYGFLPRVWRNDAAPAGHPLVLRLQGTTSNHLGVGALVRVEADGLAPQRRVVGEIASPNVVGTPVLFLGIGAATEATVEVTWPSGLVQRVEHVGSGSVTLVEPATVTLSEADRHLPADGAARLDVIVTPRAADGSARAAAVDVALAYGGGTWDGPATLDGTTWRRTLVAPTTPGSSVVVVTIDGVPVRVRPRVWWD